MLHSISYRHYTVNSHTHKPEHSLIYSSKYLALASHSCPSSNLRTHVVTWGMFVRVFVCKVRSVALSDGSECSPPPQLFESAGLRPRLFQPQLIECICTRLHNGRWVSPQLAYFKCSVKMTKLELASVSSLLFLFSQFSAFSLLTAFLPPRFSENKETPPPPKKNTVCLLLFHRGGEGGFTWPMPSQFVFHIF